MQNIKIRVYDRKEKRFSYIQFDGRVLSWPNFRWTKQNIPSMGHEVFFKNLSAGDLFTGVKDKNGTEIYDGDLVKVKDDLTQCVYDKFGIPCLVGIKYPEAHNFMELELRGSNKVMVIVGNIHENRNLLNKGQ